jgi:hypothetical protein
MGRSRIVGTAIITTALALVAGAHAPARSGDSTMITAQSVVHRVNELRRAAGLNDVELDANLTEGCRRHVRYLIINRNDSRAQMLNAHYENPELPGYSEQGLMAANNSIIALNKAPTASVEAWFASLYHRVPLLKASLMRVGFASDGGFSVMDVRSGVGDVDEKPVAFPGNGQLNVPLHMQRELPDPLPVTAPRSAGYPITMQFPEDGPEVRSAKATLMDSSGSKVHAYLSHPSAPATNFPQMNTVCLIPAKTLTPGAKYSVEVQANVEGRTVTKAWSFTTRSVN